MPTEIADQSRFETRQPNLLDALRKQWSVIVALMLREALTRYKHQKLGYFWAFGEPMIQIGTWFLIFTILRGPPLYHDLPMPLFLATGIIAFYFFSNVADYVEGAIGKNSALLRFPMVKQLDALLARFILEVATTIVVAVLIFTLILQLGVGFPPHDWLGLIEAAGCMALLGLGFGSFNAMVIELVPSYQFLQGLIGRILFLSSGAFIPVTTLGPHIMEYLQWNPVLNGVELFRAAWSYSYEPHMYSNWYVLLWAGVFMFLAMVLDKRVRQASEGE